MARKPASFSRWLQNRLTAHGMAGPDVHQAISQFQQRNGLKMTGMADQATVDALRRAPVAPPMPQPRPAMAAPMNPHQASMAPQVTPASFEQQLPPDWEMRAAAARAGSAPPVQTRSAQELRFYDPMMWGPNAGGPANDELMSVLAQRGYDIAQQPAQEVQQMQAAPDPRFSDPQMWGQAPPQMDALRGALSAKAATAGAQPQAAPAQPDQNSQGDAALKALLRQEIIKQLLMKGIPAPGIGL